MANQGRSGRRITERDGGIIKKNGYIVPNIYMIHSKQSLSQLEQFLSEFGENKDIGYLRIVYDQEGKETDRTIAIFKEDIYKKMCEEGYGDSGHQGVTIAQFSMKSDNKPGKGCNRNVFIPVPEHMRNDDSRVALIIKDKLVHLAGWNVIPDKCWHINVPVKSRQNGGVSGG